MASTAACALAVASLVGARVARSDELLSAPVVPVPAAAEQGPAQVSGVARAPVKPAKLGLDEFVQRALQAAPELEVARWDVAARQAKLDEAKASRYLPQFEALNLIGLAPIYTGTVLAPETTVDNRAFGPFTSVEVSLVQPLYTWGKLTAGVNAATHAVESEIAASEGIAADVEMQVKMLYWNVLLARSVEGVLVESRDAFQTALETATERRAGGDSEITELDILYLRVALAEIAKEVPKVQSGAQGALEALRLVSGADRKDPLDVRERLLDPVRVRIEPLEHYTGQLYDKSPQWKQVDAGVAAKAEELKTVEADFFPVFFLTGSFAYSYAPRNDRQLNPFAWDQFNYQRGPGGVFGIRWPLNFHITAAKVDAKRAELGKLESQRRQAHDGLALQLEQAYAKVVGSRAALDKLEDGRKAGRAILTLSVTNFDIGIGDAKEIMQGLSSYAQVSGHYYEAVRDYNLAVATLERVSGIAVEPSPKP
ncbi:MAG: TolC family protein [Deltaproteobacteria bacterium]|nr:TolC family protein [Deltaproteobacteria bacterium]